MPFNIDTQTFGKKWNIYKCLVAEVSIGDDVFVLSMGQWRRVSTELLNMVNDYAETINVSQPDYLLDGVSISVPNADGAPGGSNEEATYNRYVRDANDALYLFDRARIEIAGEKRYEVCDLLHTSRVFIHSKRFQSGSASISHVFVQARFYADAVFGDERCRYSMREHIAANPEERDVQAFIDLIAIPRSDIQPNEFTVIFCILTNTANLTLSDLPFMARYELTRTHKYLAERIGIGTCQVCFPTVVLGPPQA